jgi:hypothetical protein
MTADDLLLQHLEQDSEWLLQQLGQYGLISGDFGEICVPEVRDADGARQVNCGELLRDGRSVVVIC